MTSSIICKCRPCCAIGIIKYCNIFASNTIEYVFSQINIRFLWKTLSNQFYFVYNNFIFLICFCAKIHMYPIRDGNEAGQGRVSLSHTHPRKKNSSPSAYLNLTGIKLLSHPYPHRITGIISYQYSYPFSYYFLLILINFYKIIKNYGKVNIKLSNIQYYEDGCFFDIKYFEINYNYLHFKLEYHIKFHENQNIY